MYEGTRYDVDFKHTGRPIVHEPSLLSNEHGWMWWIDHAVVIVRVSFLGWARLRACVVVG